MLNAYPFNEDSTEIIDRLEETYEDLNSIEKIMEELGIIVHRPDNFIDCGKRISTPTWNETGSRQELSPRDIFLVIDATIIEMTPMSRFRYFEHWAFKDIMVRKFNEGANWISMPSPALYDDDVATYTSPWYGEPLLEAASVLLHDGNLFVSTTTTANELGIEWLRRNFCGEYTIYELDEHFDGHLDAHFNIVRPGLVATHIDKKYFPDYFKNWEFLYIDTDMDTEISKKQPFHNDLIQDDDHANTALTINFLSIDENRILLYDHHKNSKTLLEQFKKHKIEPIFIPFRHCHYFNQGITCITLELVRY